jgi:hypothetical protein
MFFCLFLDLCSVGRIIPVEGEFCALFLTVDRVTHYANDVLRLAE